MHRRSFLIEGDAIWRTDRDGLDYIAFGTGYIDRIGRHQLEGGQGGLQAGRLDLGRRDLDIGHPVAGRRLACDSKADALVEGDCVRLDHHLDADLRWRHGHLRHRLLAGVPNLDGKRLGVAGWADNCEINDHHRLNAAELAFGAVDADRCGCDRSGGGLLVEAGRQGIDPLDRDGLGRAPEVIDVHLDRIGSDDRDVRIPVLDVDRHRVRADFDVGEIPGDVERGGEEMRQIFGGSDHGYRYRWHLADHDEPCGQGRRRNRELDVPVLGWVLRIGDHAPERDSERDRQQLEPKVSQQERYLTEAPGGRRQTGSGGR